MAILKTSLGRCKSKARRLSRWVGIEQKKLDSKPKDRAQGAKAHRDQVVGERKFHVWKEGCHQKCHCGLDGMVCKPLWAGQSEDLVRCELQLCHCESLNAFQSKFADWQTFSVFPQPNYCPSNSDNREIERVSYPQGRYALLLPYRCNEWLLKNIYHSLDTRCLTCSW